ncbi:interferon-induced protein 44-like [Labeo rohita]|uniref:interferon-induced protein 44-like n=1 Tax=Labeo rohita TaxID=84645 RepID=UPI0021E2550C|nr:interferon-induced protein 44-like [Labeo rohita]
MEISVISLMQAYGDILFQTYDSIVPHTLSEKKIQFCHWGGTLSYKVKRKKKELKEKLENFSQSHPDVKDIKILVAGQIGAGKSSFINSVDSAFQGRISSRALVNSAASDYSFTKNAAHRIHHQKWEKNIALHLQGHHGLTT